MANTGFLLMAGLGALMFLGRGGTAKTTEEDPALVTGKGRGGPMPPAAPAFNLQSYVDGLFRDTTTVTEKPPMKMFYPRSVVVTSSGVPAVSRGSGQLITATTKPGIEGAGGETIATSALDILRLQQLTKQRFDAAANVGDPATDTLTRNRVDEMRQMVKAQQLVAAAKSRQVATKAMAELRSRNAQEAAARAASSVDDSYQPVIISDGLGLLFSDSTVSTTITAGQDIVTYEDDPGPEYYPQPVDFGPIYSESFVISGGMDAPSAFDIQVEMLGQSEYDDAGPEYYAAPGSAAPSYARSVTVHEVSAAYDIGF